MLKKNYDNDDEMFYQKSSISLKYKKYFPGKKVTAKKVLWKKFSEIMSYILAIKKSCGIKVLKTKILWK